MASSIEEALLRLDAALDLIEGAVHQRFDVEQKSADADAEMHLLITDRSRLAQSLDAAEARAVRLEEVNREVSRRLVAAMEAIRDVLGGAAQ